VDPRQLREIACQVNRDLARLGLVILAFGNASVVDRAAGLIAIKPSGSACADLEPDDLVLVRLADGEPLEAADRPSSDTPTHLELYRNFPTVGTVIHTHSPYATSWAQAQREIPPLGTTHADHFRGSVPVTRALEPSEIAADYEANTGRAIVERFAHGPDPLEVPAVLVASHGPFAWGASPDEALDNAVALEHVAAIATHQAALGGLEPMPATLLDRHFSRKHGPGAYYGQPAPVPVVR
jgi:L-ribulose-5-phosphate 4-epimerase